MFAILGDSNIDMIAENTITREYNQLLYSYACSNIITLPTRVTAHSATLLDVCITNVHVSSVTAGVMSSDISDHLPIFCFLPCSEKYKRSAPVHSYRLIDTTTLVHFHSLIGEINWEAELTESDPNKAYNSFFDKLIACYDTAFPQRSATRRPK